MDIIYVCVSENVSMEWGTISSIWLGAVCRIICNFRSYILYLSGHHHTQFCCVCRNDLNYGRDIGWLLVLVFFFQLNRMKYLHVHRN